MQGGGQVAGGVQLGGEVVSVLARPAHHSADKGGQLVRRPVMVVSETAGGGLGRESVPKRGQQLGQPVNGSGQV
jgi:hypothetical protein